MLTCKNIISEKKCKKLGFVRLEFPGLKKLARWWAAKPPAWICGSYPRV